MLHNLDIRKWSYFLKMRTWNHKSCCLNATYLSLGQLPVSRQWRCNVASKRGQPVTQGNKHGPKTKWPVQTFRCSEWLLAACSLFLFYSKLIFLVIYINPEFKITIPCYCSFYFVYTGGKKRNGDKVFPVEYKVIRGNWMQ